MKKYEFVEGDEKLVAPGIVAKRIRALVAIPALLWAPSVAVGELGGYIVADYNLAQVSGNAWVYGNALVYGDARVCGDARVSGDAWVYGYARVSGDAWVYGNARVSGNARVTQECGKTPILISGLRYTLTITDSHLRAGCQCHTFDQWREFSKEQIAEMDGRDALRFWPTLLVVMNEALSSRGD